MLFDNSLEKENIKLSYMNQTKAGMLAEKLQTTPDALLNEMLDIFTATNSQPVKDIRQLCQKRIKEIEKKVGHMTPQEALPYLDDLGKYEFINNLLDLKCVTKQVIGEDDDDEDIIF